MKINNILKKLPFLALLFIVFSVFGVIYTWPLTPNIASSVINNMHKDADHTYLWGDHLQVIAGFKEHKNSLESVFGGDPILEKEFCYEAETENCAPNQATKLYKAIFSPYWGHTLLNIVFDDPVVYNLVTILSFGVTGLAGFLFLREYFGEEREKNDKWLWFVASLPMVLAYPRIHHLFVGHRNGFLFAICLVAFWILLKQIKARSNIWRVIWGLGFVILSIWLAFTEKFLLLYTVGLSLVLVIDNVLSYGDLRKSMIANLHSFLTPVFALVAAFIVNQLVVLGEIANSGISEGRPFDLIRYYSPRLIELINPNTLEHEHNVYLGFGAFVILAGLVLGIHLFRKQKENGKRILFLSLAAIGIILVALGASTPVYGILYNYLPLFNLSRTPTRIIFFVFPIISILSVYVFEYISTFNVVKKYKNLALVILLFLFVGFSHPFYNVSLVGMPNYREIPENSKVLFVPITDAGHFFGSIYEFHLSNTQSTVSLNGYHPYPLEKATYFENEVAPRINREVVLTGNVSEQTLRFLENEFDIDQVIILEEFLTNPTYSEELQWIGKN